MCRRSRVSGQMCCGPFQLCHAMDTVSFPNQQTAASSRADDTKRDRRTLHCSLRVLLLCGTLKPGSCFPPHSHRHRADAFRYVPPTSINSNAAFAIGANSFARPKNNLHNHARNDGSALENLPRTIRSALSASTSMGNTAAFWCCFVAGHKGDPGHQILTKCRTGIIWIIPPEEKFI
jgi:hypothetical protein